MTRGDTLYLGGRKLWSKTKLHFRHPINDFYLMHRGEKRSLLSRSLSLFSPSRAMDLRQFVSRFESHFPPPLAEKWDNVGLLVEPTGYKPGTNFGEQSCEL